MDFLKRNSGRREVADLGDFDRQAQDFGGLVFDQADGLRSREPCLDFAISHRGKQGRRKKKNQQTFIRKQRSKFSQT